GGGEARDVEAQGVDAQRDERNPGRLERLPRARVVRLLHAEALARLQQEAGGDAERLLRAVGDEDLLRAAADPAPAGQVLGDRRAQRRQAGRRRVVEIRGRGGTRVAADEARPDRAREVVEGRTPAAEVVVQAARGGDPACAAGDERA